MGYFSMTTIGHLGRAPEYKRTEKGTPLTTFSLGVSRGKDEAPMWCIVSIFGKEAEYVAGLDLKVGDEVLVRCDQTPKLFLYLDKTGTQSGNLDLIVSHVSLISRKSSRSGSVR